VIRMLALQARRTGLNPVPSTIHKVTKLVVISYPYGGASVYWGTIDCLNTLRDSSMIEPSVDN
jgi:hypothetical protein